MSEQTHIQENTRKFWRATFALSLGSFSVFSNLHMAQPLLPLFTKHFGVPPTTASLSVSLVTFTLSLFLLFFGPFSDAIGRKKVMATGLFISSILSIVMFFISNFTFLLILRAIQGIFLASLPAISYAYIAEEFESKSIGVVIGIYISGNSIGGMGGRIISGFVADTLGWEYSFLVIGIIGLIAFFLFLILLPNSSHFQSRKFSNKKAIKEISTHWKNPLLRKAYYVAAIIFFIFVGLFNYLSYHLHDAPYSLSTTLIGLLYLTYIAGTFSSTYSGKLESKISIPMRVLLGLITMLVGMIFMLFRPLISILIGLVIIVFGFFFAHSAASSWVSQKAEQAKASASALYLFSYYLGGSLGSFLLGFIWTPFGWKAVIGVTIFMVLIGMQQAWKMKYLEEESTHPATYKSFNNI